MSDLTKLCEDKGVKVVKADYQSVVNRGDSGKAWQASHWKVTLGYSKRRLTVDYYMGMAHRDEPKVADVVYSLCMDSRAGDMSFEDFCSDFGYDADSRKAESVWKACVKGGKKVRKFLGDDFDTFANAEH